MTNFVRVAVVAVLALACTSQGATSSPGSHIPMVRLRAEPYSFTYSSGLQQRARLVVRDVASWQTLWNEIHSNRSYVPLPVVDFSREMIVVAALGARSSGGFSILLDEASEDTDGTIQVTVHSISPGRSCVVTAAFTQPVDIARVPRREGPIRFIERSSVSTCE